MLTETADRVAAHTDIDIDRRIEMETDERVRWYAKNPGEIGRRIEELDREWDIERMLQANAGAAGVIGVLMGLMRSRVWYLLSAAAGGVLIQHATEGWSPPLILLRRLGLRTAREIEHERLALKIIRGDFVDHKAGGDRGTTAAADAALSTARM
jgi:hypothetical protein